VLCSFKKKRTFGLGSNILYILKVLWGIGLTLVLLNFRTFNSKFSNNFLNPRTFLGLVQKLSLVSCIHYIPPKARGRV
jgi:hypothetical protein